MVKAELVQIVYDDPQFTAEFRASKCFPIARIYKNEKLTIFFENSVIKEQVLNTKMSKIAICSWELRNKLRAYIGRPRELTQETLESDYDVLAMTKNTKYHSMLAFARANHPGFSEVFPKLIAKIGITSPHEVKIPIYQNAFSARSEIYKDYVKSYLIPAMDCMQSDPELNKLIMTDSNYSKLKRVANYEDHLTKQIGIPYYPLAPFVLERLFSVYVHNKKITVTYL